MYHPTGRVLTLLEIVQTHPGITGPELAMRLQTDVRTIRRYVTKLQDVGIPIAGETGRYGGYKLRPGYRLPPLIFSEDEAIAVVLGLVGNRFLEIDQPQAAIAGALSKITRVLPAPTRQRVEALSSVAVLPAASLANRPGAAMFLTLIEGIQAEECVDIDYPSSEGTPTHRRVEPYGLLGRRGRWYLIAFCRLREDYRIFRLDRITNPRRVPEAFSKDTSFDWEGFASSRLETRPDQVQFTVRFEASAQAVRSMLAGYGKVTETSTGTLFEATADSHGDAARYLMWLHLPFTVVEPLELRGALKDLSIEAEHASRAAASGLTSTR